MLCPQYSFASSMSRAGVDNTGSWERVFDVLGPGHCEAVAFTELFPSRPLSPFISNFSILKELRRLPSKPSVHTVTVQRSPSVTPKSWSNLMGTLGHQPGVTILAPKTADRVSFGYLTKLPLSPFEVAHPWTLMCRMESR